MVGQLAASSGAIVFRVDDPLDQVLGLAVDNERWRRRLFAVLEGVGVLRFKLRNVEDGVDANCSREAKGEGGCGRLGDDGERSNLLLSQLSSSAVSTNVIRAYVHAVSDVERGSLHPVLIRGARHNFLSVLHTVTKERVDLIEVDCVMARAQISDLCIWMDGDQRVVSSICEEGGDARSGVRRIIISELS